MSHVRADAAIDGGSHDYFANRNNLDLQIRTVWSGEAHLKRK
jgi:hypothetical protein